jgi:SHAQKYF class myb-like DNA-binding protein
MSVDMLIPSSDEIKSPSPKRRKQNKQAGQSAGRWTRDEHQAFLAGLKEFGREWKKVATRIPTRTSAQIRSHAQKYFSKIERDQEAMALPEGAIPVVESGRMTPSVQRNIDRLLSDPHAAQREVETTMGALRERYRQLQLRLARRQQRTTTSPTAAAATDARARMVVENYGHSRKRSYSQIMEGHDDVSSVSSNISASVASLDNEELIALRVLIGGALPRGDNNSTNSTDGAQEEVKSDRSMASHEQEGGGEGHQKTSSETN